MLPGIGAAPHWSNLRLKIRAKFLECRGEFSATTLVTSKLQKYVALIVVELGPRCRVEFEAVFAGLVGDHLRNGVGGYCGRLLLHRELGWQFTRALFHNVINKFGELPFLGIALGGQVIDLSSLIHLECEPLIAEDLDPERVEFLPRRDGRA